MPAARNKAPSKLRCEEATCENRTFSTPSNLARHINSMHGEPIQMPCGMLRQDHPSNSPRHQLRCSECRAVLGLPSLDPIGSPMLDVILNEVDNAPDTVDIIGAQILDETLGELNNARGATGAPIFDNTFDQRVNIFNDFGIPILDETVNEFDDALAITFRDYNNMYNPSNNHYPGFF